jgi:hypothetical protein
VDKSQCFTDLGEIYLKMSVKILKKDDKALVAKDIVGLINAFGHSMFSGIDVFLQDRLVSRQNGLHPYQTYLRLLLYTSPTEKETLLKQAIWSKDEAGLMDEIGKDGKAAKNSGFTERSAKVQNSKEFELVFKLLYDFSLQQLIPNQTEIFFRFHRADASFCLMADSDTYRVNITKARMLVPRIQVTKVGEQLVNQLARTHGLCLSAMRVESYSRLVGKNDQNCDWTVFSGTIPKRIYIFQSLNSAYNGDISKNPFNFQSFNLKKLQLYVNDRCLPLAQGIDVSSDDGWLLYALTMKAVNQSDSTSFDPDDYTSGYMIACFDLTRDYSGWGLYDAPPVQGTVRIVLDYDKPLADSVSLFCVTEQAGALHMDENHNFAWLS